MLLYAYNSVLKKTTSTRIHYIIKAKKIENNKKPQKFPSAAVVMPHTLLRTRSRQSYNQLWSGEYS